MRITTREQLQAAFDKFGDENHKFDDIVNKFSTCPDIHAFILLNKLVPSTLWIVAAAEHDEIFLETDIDKLLAVVTESDISDLQCCGVFYNDSYDSLQMFV